MTELGRAGIYYDIQVLMEGEWETIPRNMTNINDLPEAIRVLDKEASYKDTHKGEPVKHRIVRYEVVGPTVVEL